MELNWSIKTINNGFLVDNEMFFKKLKDAITYLKREISRECKVEFEGCV